MQCSFLKKKTEQGQHTAFETAFELRYKKVDKDDTNGTLIVKC